MALQRRAGLGTDRGEAGEVQPALVLRQCSGGIWRQFGDCLENEFSGKLGERCGRLGVIGYESVRNWYPIGSFNPRYHQYWGCILDTLPFFEEQKVFDQPVAYRSSSLLNGATPWGHLAASTDLPVLRCPSELVPVPNLHPFGEPTSRSHSLISGLLRFCWVRNTDSLARASGLHGTPLHPSPQRKQGNTGRQLESRWTLLAASPVSHPFLTSTRSSRVARELPHGGILFISTRAVVAGQPSSGARLVEPAFLAWKFQECEPHGLPSASSWKMGCIHVGASRRSSSSFRRSAAGRVRFRWARRSGVTCSRPSSRNA